MKSLETTKSNEFHFDAAIAAGVAYDKSGHEYAIIANGSEFMIARCGDKEHCFNRLGKQFSDFPSASLVSPFREKEQLLTYLAYDEDTLEIIAQGREASLYRLTKSKGHDRKKINCINITHPLNQSILKSLGINHRYWYL